MIGQGGVYLIDFYSQNKLLNFVAFNRFTAT